MKYVKLFLVGLSLFTMLTACGEGFKSKAVSSRGDHDQVVDDGKNAVTPGNTSAVVDDRIRAIYENEIGGLDTAMIENLANSIKAFELELTVTEHPGGASQNVSANAIMMLGCDSGLHYGFSRASLNESTLQAGDPVSLGSDGLYEVILQCTVSDCDEAVATVRRQGDGATDALVLIGLKVSNTENSSRTTIRTFKTRLVRRSDEIYTTALTPSFYLDNACRMGEMESEVDLDAFGDPVERVAVDPLSVGSGGVQGDFDRTEPPLSPFLGTDPF